MDIVRFGVIGAGIAGPYFGQSLTDLADTELVAVATTREETARSFAKKYDVPHWYTDWRQIMDRKDIDAVAVITPNHLHHDMVIAAAEVGKHVIVEKPIATTLAQADRMIASCERAAVTFGVIFMYRFMGTVLQIKQAVDEGLLGKLILGDSYVKYYRSQEYYEMAPWRGTWWGEGGGALINQAIHTIDLQLWIMGDVDSLAGFCTTGAHRIEVDDLAVASLSFKSGALGAVVGATATTPGYPRRLELHGEKGTVVLLGDDISVWDVEGMDGSKYLNQPSKDLGNTFSGPGYADPANHEMQLRDFVDAIKQGRQPLVDGREGRKALEVVVGIYQSSRTGKVIKFPVKE